MKIAYIISPKAKETEAHALMAIYQTLEKLGHQHITDFAKKVEPSEFYQEGSKSAARFFESVEKYIGAADVCIFETSSRSLALGHLIHMAISKNKPVIALYQGNNKPLFLANMLNSRVQVVKYDLDNLRDQLFDTLEIAEEMVDIRFNLLLSQAHITFLKSKSQTSKIPVAGLIRQLIEREMKNKK